MVDLLFVLFYVEHFIINSYLICDHVYSDI